MAADRRTRISETGRPVGSGIGTPSRALIAAAGALVALHLFGGWASLAGRADLWGLAPWLGASRSSVLIWLLLPLPLFALERLRLSREPRARILAADVLLGVGLAGLWLFRDALSLDGDGRLLLAQAASGQVHSESAPWLNGLLVSAAGIGERMGTGAETTLRAGSVLAGIGFVTIARALWPGTLLLLVSPFMLLFAGWIELYPYVWLIGLAFLVAVVRASRSVRWFAAAAGAAVALPLVHPSLALLLPALFVPAAIGPALFVRARVGPAAAGSAVVGPGEAARGRRLRIAGAALAVAGAVAVRALLVGPWPGSGFLPVDPERIPYGWLDPRHFLESAWLILLLVPAAVGLPFLRRRVDSEEAVLGVAAMGAAIGSFLVLPALGYARDWDLMALPALPLALLAARRVERCGSPWFAALVLALVLSRTVGWVAVHHDADASIRRARMIANTASLNSAFARSHLHDDLSHVLEGLGRPEAAAVESVAAATLRPGSARMHYRVGYLARRHGDPAVAERSLAEAVRIEPEFFDARHELGMALVRRSAWDEAALHLRVASNLRPDDVRVRANLAVTLINAGRVDEAAPEVEWIAGSLDPARQRALENIVRALEAVGAVEAAARVRELL